MADRKPSLASDAFALSIGNASLHAAALISVMVLARLLSAPELGAYQQLFLLYGVISPLLLGGIPAALLFFLPQEPDRGQRAAWITTAYVLATASGLLFSVLVLVLRAPLAELLNEPDIDRLLALWSPYPLLLFIASVAPSALVASRRAPLAGALNGFNAALMLAGVIAGAAISRDAYGAAVGLVVSGVLSAVASVIAVAATSGIAPLPSATRARIRRVAAYGIPLALTGVAGMLGYQLDRIVVSAEFDPAAYAIYALGAVEIPVAVLVQQSVNTVLAPALTRHWAERDIDGMMVLWREAIRLTSLVLLPVFVVSMVLSHDLIVVLFGARYEESVSVFRIYVCLVPLRVATYGLIPMAIGRTRMNLTASLVLLAANLVLVFSLIDPLGLEGAALAAVLATAITAAWYLLRISSLLGIGVGPLFPWATLGINLVLSTVAALPVVPLLLLADLPPLVTLCAGGIAYAAAYVVVMRATHRITDADWARLTGRLPLRRKVA
jgi:O-antigen/teichoic acid export membrane protein